MTDIIQTLAIIALAGSLFFQQRINRNFVSMINNVRDLLNRQTQRLSFSELSELPPNAVGVTINGVNYTRAEYDALRKRMMH